MSNKVKFDIEFPIQSSPAFLYQYLSTPDGLSEWFADNVNSRSDIYTFIWNGSEEKAKRISYRTNERIRYKWLEDEDENAFFEFKILVDALTKDVSLIITDFAYEDEVDESKMFWDNQISELKHLIGA
ncbi:MAG: SRPBCC domain-containing protein [Flavobacteriaceae bacterium]|nr:SRPBCC domain-containing protein [Flavobacteriaceae bacterium]MCB0475771.1 SRPBCC domain-containing protein [Flavobacteriaceae bacterium]